MPVIPIIIVGLAAFIGGGLIASGAASLVVASGETVITFLGRLYTFMGNFMAASSFLLPSWLFYLIYSALMIMVAFWIIKLFVGFLSTVPSIIGGGS